MSNSPSTIPQGNVKNEWIVALTLSPTSVANATSAEQTFACTGVLLGDMVSVNKPTTQAGLGIVGSRVSANDVIAFTFMNATSATITPTASQVYTVRVSRPESVASNVSVLTQIP